MILFSKAYLSNLFSSKFGNRDVLVYLIWAMPILGYILAFLNKFPIGDLIAAAFYPIAILFLTANAWHAIKNDIRFSDILFYIIILLIWCIEFVLFPQNNFYQEEYALHFLLRSLPYFFLGLILNIEDEYKMLSFISSCVIIITMVYRYFYMSTSGDLYDNEKRNEMYISYVLLPHVLMCVWMALKNKQIWYIAISVVGTFMMLSFGTRGAILDVLIFIVYFILFFYKSRKIFLWAIGITILGLIVISNISEILSFLIEKFTNLNLSTRILDLMIQDNLTSDASIAGRSQFKDILLPMVLNGPFFGYGLCGCFLLINTYPHDLFLDLSVSFGLLPGLLILMTMIGCIISAYKKAGDPIIRQFLTILIITGFVKLFFSYTFINNYETYLLLGFCIRIIRTNRINKCIILNH